MGDQHVKKLTRFDHYYHLNDLNSSVHAANWAMQVILPVIYTDTCTKRWSFLPSSHSKRNSLWITIIPSIPNPQYIQIRRLERSACSKLPVDSKMVLFAVVHLLFLMCLKISFSTCSFSHWDKASLFQKLWFLTIQAVFSNPFGTVVSPRKIAKRLDTNIPEEPRSRSSSPSSTVLRLYIMNQVLIFLSSSSSFFIKFSMVFSS